MAYAAAPDAGELALLRSAGRQVDRRRAAVPRAAAPAGRRPGRAGRVRRRGRLVLHPGGHRGDRRGRGPGPGPGRPAGLVRRGPGGGRPAGDPARGGRVQRGVAAAADLATVRAGPLAGPGGPGVRAVLAGPGRRRGRAVPGGQHRGRRHLAAAHPAPGAGGGPGRIPARGGHGPPSARRAPVGPRGAVPGRGHAGGGPGPDPRPRGRPGRLHLPRRGYLRAGEAAGGGPRGTAPPGPGGGPGARRAGPPGP